MNEERSIKSLQDSKRELRARLGSISRSMTAEERSRQSAILAGMIRAAPAFAAAKHVLLFAPLADEADISVLVDFCLQTGVTTALPRHSTLAEEYEAAIITKPLGLLPKGRFNIPEPEAGAPVLDWNLLDFVLVPGLAFDGDGHRLGRGRGFYDRLLTKAHGVKCGVAFEHQVVEAVPVEPHDVPLDVVAAPGGWIASSRPGANR